MENVIFNFSYLNFVDEPIINVVPWVLSTSICNLDLTKT